MTTSDPAEAAEYLEKIERHFGLRRGGRLLLSPRDWQLVQEWRERGVPLAVVLRGINRAFDRFEATPRSDRINSLGYCAQQVDEVWEQERERAAEDGDAARDDRSARERPASHLRRVAEACAGAATDRPDEIRARLEAVATELRSLADRLTADETGARDVDARAMELEGEARDAAPDLFAAAGEHGADPDGRAPLPSFSPWAL